MSAAFDYRGARQAVFTSGLPGALRLLLLALIEYMPHCSPSVASLARDCGVERKTVLRGLASLERASVLAVERRSGARSVYALRPPADWRFGYSPNEAPSPVPPSGTGPGLVPVPDERTGPPSPPVPNEQGTGTNEGMGPVPTEPQTGPTVGPKAGRSRSESGSEAAHARALEAAGFPRSAPPLRIPSRTYTMPSEEPTESYLGACVMAGVSPAQARSTWSHYVGAGLPLDGVDRLEWWLVQRAKEKQNKTAAQQRKTGSPPPARPGDDLDTTGAAMAWRPNGEAVAFAREHLKGHDLAQLASECRAVPRFAALGTVHQDAEFLARLRYLKATGSWKADGPLNRTGKRLPEGSSPR